MIERGINFSAGPAAMPEAILQQAKEDILNWQSLGCGILEIGHRTDAFMTLLEETTALFKAALNVPDNFSILWLGIPTRMHFSAIPMNFLKPDEKAAYVLTGMWSEMAFNEAKRLYPNASDCIASGKAESYKGLPLFEKRCDAAKYLYFTPNETVHGVRFYPSREMRTPWIADMTSCILAETIDFESYACIFAGAQKNLANAGLSVMLIRDDFLQQDAASTLPLTLDYRTHVKHNSLYVTPPTFNIYLANLTLKWLKQAGGVAYFETLNQTKALRLYEALDVSSIFQVMVDRNARSNMNVCFTSGREDLDDAFIKYAKSCGLMGLKGHRAVGGLRASLYNAISLADVDSLIACLQAFEQKA
jgi:phosphoserine aminotransferase